jgi:hypothetical protein
MPEASLLLGAIGVFAVALALAGLYRRRLVAVWRIGRDEQPLLFWLGFAFQLGLGLACLGIAVQVWAEASAAV